MDIVTFNGICFSVGLIFCCISFVMFISVAETARAKAFSLVVCILCLLIAIFGVCNARRYNRWLKAELHQVLLDKDNGAVKSFVDEHGNNFSGSVNTSVVVKCINFRFKLRRKCRDGIIFSEFDLAKLRTFKDKLNPDDMFYAECLQYIEGLTNDDEVNELQYICGKALLDKGCIIEGHELLYGLGDYKDSKTLALNCDYLGDVMYNLYTFCKSCIDCKEYDKALEGLKMLKEVGYKDSVSLYDLCEKEIKNDE